MMEDNKMNKKIIIFGSFLAVFLMLMIPVVNAIEYNHIENNYKEQLKQINILTSYKSSDVEKLNKTIDEILNNPDGSCPTCEKSLLMRPKCKMLLKQFLKLTWLIFILDKFKIIPNSVIILMFLSSLAVVYRAKLIYCLWAL